MNDIRIYNKALSLAQLRQDTMRSLPLTRNAPVGLGGLGAAGLKHRFFPFFGQ